MTSDKRKTISLGPLTLEKVKEINGFTQCRSGQELDGFVELIARENAIVDQEKLDMKSVKTHSPTFLANLAPVHLKYAQIKTMTNEELIKALTGELNPKSNRLSDGSIQLVSNELLTRQVKESSKPHWTVTPTFIVACVASLLAAISIIVTIYFSVFYKVENNDEHANQSYAVAKNAAPK